MFAVGWLSGPCVYLPAMATAGARRAARRWIPRQHGAWAMLTVPPVAGAVLGGLSGWDGVLLPAWLLAYAAAYHAQEYVRLRRISPNPRAARRHRAPAAAFAAGLAVLGAALALARPWLIAAAAMTPFFAVNIVYAYRNDERATLNGLAAVIPACAMLLVSYRLGAGHLDAAAWSAAAACLLYFAGSVLYVKTMIRERRSRAYRLASGAYHGLSVIAAALLQPWLAAVFGFYLVRALVLPGRGLKVPVVGAVEIVNSAVLLAAVLLLL